MSGRCTRRSARDICQSLAAVRRFLTGDAECVIRCSPGEDATNGFFVSCFVRQSQGGSTKLGKRSRPSVIDANGEGATRECGERIIRTERGGSGQKLNRSKRRKSSSST